MLKINILTGSLFVILLFQILLQVKITEADENKIIFKIENDSYTSIDFNNREKYLLFVSEDQEIDKNYILDDFISVLLFNKYFSEYGETNNEINNTIKQIYENIKNSKIDFNEINLSKKDKDNILNHIKLDLIRKTVIEEFLNKKRNEIFGKNEEINILYNFNIYYLNVFLEEINKIEEGFDIADFQNIDSIIKYFKNQGIQFFSKKEEIYDINKLNSDLKKDILEDNLFRIKENDNFISVISIEKKFETYEGLIAKIISIDTKNKIEKSRLKCENLDNLNDNIDIIIRSSEYEFLKLNEQIKNNLVDINDFIVFSSNENFKYVILCGIKFDRDILNNNNINKKVQNIAKNIEKEFILKYSKIYNLNK